MAETQETVADIVAALRQEAEDCPDIERAGIYNRYADRIEAIARRAYNEIDSAVCAIEDVSHFDIDDVRKVMERTIGDYYE